MKFSELPIGARFSFCRNGDLNTKVADTVYLAAHGRPDAVATCAAGTEVYRDGKPLGRVVERFVVKHYVGDGRCSIKGNGFDGLEVGEDREDAEKFVAFVNAAMVTSMHEPVPNVSDAGSFPFGEGGGWVCLADGDRDLILDGQFSLEDLERLVATLRSLR